MAEYLSGVSEVLASIPSSGTEEQIAGTWVSLKPLGCGAGVKGGLSSRIGYWIS